MFRPFFIFPARRAKSKSVIVGARFPRPMGLGDPTPTNLISRFSVLSSSVSPRLSPFTIYTPVTMVNSKNKETLSLPGRCGF